MNQSSAVSVVFVVDLTKSRIPWEAGFWPWEAGFWPRLWDILLMTLINKERVVLIVDLITL